MAVVHAKARRKKGVDLRKEIGQLAPISAAIGKLGKEKRKAKKGKPDKGFIDLASHIIQGGKSKKESPKDPSVLGKLQPNDLILRKIDGCWHVYLQSGEALEILERHHFSIIQGNTVYVPTLYPDRDFDDVV